MLIYIVLQLLRHELMLRGEKRFFQKEGAITDHATNQSGPIPRVQPDPWSVLGAVQYIDAPMPKEELCEWEEEMRTDKLEKDAAHWAHRVQVLSPQEALHHPDLAVAMARAAHQTHGRLRLRDRFYGARRLRIPVRDKD
jgi:hypothetical protein